MMGGLHHGIDMDNLPKRQPDWPFPATPALAKPQWGVSRIPFKAVFKIGLIQRFAALAYAKYMRFKKAG